MKPRLDPLTIAVLLTPIACSSANPEPNFAPPAPTSEAAEPAPRAAGSETEDYRPGLASPNTRQATIQKLIARFDTVARNGTQTDTARAFTFRYASPLATAFVDGYDDLPSETRKDTINLLVSFKHPDGVPAALFALERYAEAANEPEEAIWACQLLQQVPSSSAAPALLKAFDSIDMSDKHGRRVGTHLQRAMLTNADPSWSDHLAQLLDQAPQRPASFNDRPAVRAYQNQRYWQNASVRLLGELRAATNSRVILRAWLTRSKRELHDDALLALLKIGAKATSDAEALLAGSDAELTRLATEKYPEQRKAHVFAGAQLMGYLAAPQSFDALSRAWQEHDDVRLRVALVRAMSALPKSEETSEYWRRTFSQTSVKTTLPMGESGLEVLATAGLQMFEPGLVEWVTPRVETLRGGGPRTGDAQRALVLMISHLVLAHQAPAANRVALKYGGRVATPAFEQGVELADRCKDNADCYLGAIKTSSAMTESEMLLSIKAIAMTASFGRQKHKQRLLALVERAPQAQVLKVLLRAIEHLSPATDTEAGQQLTEYAKTLRGPGTTLEQQTRSSLIERTALRLTR